MTGRRNSFIFWTAVLVLSMAAALLLQFASQHFQGFADAYTRNIYPHIVAVLGGFWGKVPFSAVEILLYVFLLFWLLLLIISVIRVIQKRLGAFKRLLLLILALSATCSVLFFVYTANCGVNYYARPFSEEAGLTRSAVSKMIVKLEKMGLVERYRYYPNQREVYVHLTDRGVDACDGYDRYHDEMNRRLRQYFGSLRTDQKMDILAFLYYYINEQKCLPE